MSKENLVKEIIRTKLSEAGMSSKFRKAAEEYKEVSLKLQDLYADRAKALEGYKKAEGGEKEKYKNELSRIQKLVSPLQAQMEKAERVFNKALLSEPEELEETNIVNMNEAKITSIPNLNLESDAYIVMYDMLKSNSKFKSIVAKGIVDYATGGRPEHIVNKLSNDLVRGIVTDKFINSVAGEVNKKSPRLSVSPQQAKDAAIRLQFSKILATGLIFDFNENMRDTAKMTGDSEAIEAASEFSVNRGKAKFKTMMGNKFGETVDKDGMERVAAGLPQTEEEPVNESASSVIKNGDKVTIRTPQKQLVSGKAVMKSPHGGWALNMGGKYGRPGSADDRNIVKVMRGGKVIYSESVTEATADAIAKDLDKVRGELLKKVSDLVAKKKKLYSNVDISSPMSAEEKKLDKEIADAFSQINQLVKQKRDMKTETVSEAKFNHINTGEKTINKKVMDKVKETFPMMKSVKKKNVPNMGEVLYIHDENGNGIGQVYVDKQHGAVIDVKEGVSEALKPVNEWKLQLDLGKVNPSQFEDWASDSFQKKHKIKVSGSDKNWTIVGKGNDDKTGSSADWITRLLGKAWTTNKIKVVQKESISEGKNDKKIKELEAKLAKVKGKTPGDEGIRAAIRDDIERLKTEGLSEALNPATGEWILFKVISPVSVKKKFMSTHKSHRSAQIAMKKALDKMNINDEFDGYGIMSKDKWDKEDSRFKVESVSEGKKFGSKYDIGMGHMGSGVTVWNRLQKQGGDYKTIAHISDAGKVSFRDKSLPDDVKKYIEDYAKKGMNEMVNEASKRANDVFGDSKHGQEIHKMLKGKWDAKKVDDYLEELGDGSIQKNLRIIDFITKAAGLNPRTYDTKTLGKQISDLIDKLEVLYKDFTKGTDLKKFDDVRIKSKNLTGMVYAISGNTIVVKTANGLVKATKDDVEPVLSDGVMKEGNAFGMAVTQAKKDGKKEFEFNGKTYKVKKGAIEENEKETISESDCGCGAKVVVSEAVNVRKLLQMNVARELKVSPSSIEVGVGGYGSRTANDGSQVVVIGLDSNVKKISIPQADYFDKTVDYGGYLIVKADGKTGKLLKVLDRVKSQNDIRMMDYIKEVNENITEAVKEPEVIAKIRGIVKNHQHASIKDPKLGKPVKVDAFSASAIIQVYDAINDTNKAKFAGMSIHQMATVAYKLMKK